jgi:site-specific DNA-methyltransferase (adenine-specific)
LSDLNDLKMKAYFSTDLGALYLGDCLEVMPRLKQRFSVALTDPPYGIEEGRKANHRRIKKTLKKGKNTKGTEIHKTDFGHLSWDNAPPPKKAFELIYQLSDNQMIFGGNYFVEYLKRSSCWIVWDKCTGNSPFLASSELIYTSFKTAVRIIKWRWNGMLQQDMRHKEKRFHPTQKPVRLLEILLTRYAKKGDSILDPFAGVGSTAVACENLRHPWVIIEQHEPYAEIAAKRIEETASQMKF